MPTAPKPLTLRPLTVADLAPGQDIDLEVWVATTHAGQTFYEPGTIKTIRREDVTNDGLLAHQVKDRRPNPERQVVGERVEVVARTTRSEEYTTHLYSSDVVIDALFGGGDDSARARRERQNSKRVCVAGDGGLTDFPARTLPIFGTEVNIRLVIPDMDPEEALAAITALVADQGRVLRAQARTVPDLRVDVYDTTPDTDFNAREVLIATRVLTAEVWEYMQDVRSVTTRAVPYGTPTPAIGQ